MWQDATTIKQMVNLLVRYIWRLELASAQREASFTMRKEVTDDENICSKKTMFAYQWPEKCEGCHSSRWREVNAMEIIKVTAAGILKRSPFHRAVCGPEVDLAADVHPQQLSNRTLTLAHRYNQNLRLQKGSVRSAGNRDHNTFVVLIYLVA